MNMTITPKSNKTNFYNSCNSKETPFDNSDHNTLSLIQSATILMYLTPNTFFYKKTIFLPELRFS